MADSPGTDTYDSIAAAWERHLSPIAMYVLHRASVGYARPRFKERIEVPGLNRLAASLDALLPAFCDIDAKGGMPPSLIIKVTASSMLKSIIVASVERLPILTWQPAHSSIASMLGYDEGKYLTSFDQWVIEASGSFGGTVTPWGTNAPDAHGVYARIVPQPSIADALTLATSLLPDRASA